MLSDLVFNFSCGRSPRAHMLVPPPPHPPLPSQPPFPNPPINPPPLLRSDAAPLLSSCSSWPSPSRHPHVPPTSAATPYPPSSVCSKRTHTLPFPPLNLNAAPRPPPPLPPSQSQCSPSPPPSPLPLLNVPLPSARVTRACRYKEQRSVWTDVVIGQTPLFAHESKVKAPLRLLPSPHLLPPALALTHCACDHARSTAREARTRRLFQVHAVIRPR
jgi:hypothetical protein